jgi:acetyl esterase/lipase
LLSTFFNQQIKHKRKIDLLSSATKSVWISVEYRLAPEHKFPIWLDDACEVTQQILANKTAYGTRLMFPFHR